MKIAFLTPEYITEKNFDGGLASYSERVAIGLSKRGHHVAIFTLSDKDGYLKKDGISIYRIKDPQILLKRIKFSIIGRHKIFVTNYISSIKVCRKFLKVNSKSKFDIVQNSSYRWLGYFLAKKRVVPIVTRVSSFTPIWRRLNDVGISLDDCLNEYYEQLTMELSNSVYSPSISIKNILDLFINKRIDVIEPPFFQDSNGTDPKTYNSCGAIKNYILYFGTLSKMKGLEIILRNLESLLRENKDLSFVFIGKDCMNLRKRLFEITTSNPELSNRILLLSKMRHNQLVPFVKNARVVIIPSLIDNLPNTCIESMSLGKVVIGLKQSGIEQLITDKVSGFLVPKDNDQEFCKIVNEVLRLDASEKRSIEKNATKRIKQMSPDINLSLLENYYKEIIQVFKNEKQA